MGPQQGVKIHRIDLVGGHESLRIGEVHAGSQEQRELAWRTPAHVYVTTYETLRQDLPGSLGAAGATGDATAGGVGVSSSITGSAVFRAGGGGDGGDLARGLGGNGGGGNGGFSGTAGSAESANTGGGGEGQIFNVAGYAGGSGVVILKYSDGFTITNPGGGLTFSTPSPAGGFKVTTFTVGTGNIQFN